MKGVITIGREYGSGGREIGAKLAKAFDIPFYDNELITRAAKESGFSEAIFENAEKKATNSLLYSIAMGMSSYGVQDGGFSSLSLDDRAYIAQSDVIRKVADEGACVIVGRCADYILRDRTYLTNIFIHADMDFRIERAIRVNGVPEDKVKDTIAKLDKSRANYYNYHTGLKWGKSSNYHMSINSTIGVDETVECLKKYIEMREKYFNR